MNGQPSVKHDTQLSQLSRFLTYRVSRLHGKLNAQASRILRDSVGVTLNQWRMIAFIGGAGKITASELISYTAMDKGLVSRNLKSLIENGLVLSSPDDRDNRVHLLTLSPTGKNVFEAALPKMRRRQERLQENLSADDISTFRRVMDALEKAAEETDSQ